MTDPVKQLQTPALPLTIDPATLRFHPLANQFDMIEDGEDGGAAFDALKASIARSGINVPIKLFESQVLDGRNRLKAGLAIRHTFTARDFEIFVGTPEDAKAYVDAANIHRRHLSKEQKEKIIKSKLAEHPNASNRQIAKMCGVSHTHVNNIRKEKPPEGDKTLERFENAWEALTDQQRQSFVDKFAPDLEEMVQIGLFGTPSEWPAGMVAPRARGTR